MADETIIADEQKNTVDVQDETEELEEMETEQSEDNDSDDYVDVNEVLEQNRKLQEENEKWKNRYKSTKKKQATAPKQTPSNPTNIDAVVEKKLAEIEAKRNFIAAHWEEVYEHVAKIKSKHPTLSLEDAYKISPAANDPASKENPAAYSMGGRGSNSAITDSKSISQEKLASLPQKEYNIAKEKIERGELQIKG